MSNFATLFKTEVSRLTRKELKLQVDPLRKQVAAQRKTILGLKQDIAKLQKASAITNRAGSARVAVERAENAPATRARFSADGLKKLRMRLGLTREAFAPLLGVSSQSIYIWESGQAHPRQESVDKLAIVRGMTKQQAQDVLAQHASSGKRVRKPAAQKASGRKPKKATTKSAKKAGRDGAASKRPLKKAAMAKKAPKSEPRMKKPEQIAATESVRAQ